MVLKGGERKGEGKKKTYEGPSNSPTGIFPNA